MVGRRKSTAGKMRLMTLLVAIMATSAQAQFLAANNRNSDRPAPRLADGTINLSGPSGEIGNWEGNAGAVLFTNPVEGAIDNAGLYLPSNLSVDDVPWQDWSRAA